MNEISDSDDITDANVDQLRKSWEIEDHWLLRRDFILAHKDKFAFDRLLCLAQVFVNVETLGNSYDIEIMKQIRQLEGDVEFAKERRERKKQLDVSNKPKPVTNSEPSHGEKRRWQEDHSNYQYYQSNRGNNRGRGGGGGYQGQNRGHNQHQGYRQYQQRGRQESDSHSRPQNYPSSNYNQSSYNNNPTNYNAGYNNYDNNSRNNSWQASSNQPHHQAQSRQYQQQQQLPSSTSQYGFSSSTSSSQPVMAQFQPNYYNDIPSYSTSSPPHQTQQATEASNSNRRSAQSFF